MYLLIDVLHDWSDESYRIILGSIVRAVNPKSKILIEEYMMADLGVSFHPAGADISMMMLPGGVQRTKSQCAQLCASVEPSLKIAKVWNKHHDRDSIVEVRLVA